MMRKTFFYSNLFWGLLFGSFAWASEEPVAIYATNQDVLAQGRSLFNAECASCHMLENDAIGPKLGGVTTVLNRTALHAFIKNPAAVVASGDARANALVRSYKMIMPAFGHLPEAHIDSIIAYIHQQSTEKKLTPFLVAADSTDTTPSHSILNVALNATSNITSNITPNAALNVTPHVAAPVTPSGIVIGLEDVAVIPTLPGRTAYKGITLMRPDPRVKGAYFVVDLMGMLYGLHNKKVQPFLNIRDYFPQFVYDPGVATGLGSVALHPAFRNNGLFYTTHAEFRHGSKAINSSDIPVELQQQESPSLEWVLTEWKMHQASAKIFSGTHREVLRIITPTTAHGVQEINFSPITNPRDPDYAKLYISCGDGGSFNIKRPDLAGHTHSLLGSILRIDPAGTNGPNGQYGIPAANPFANTQDPLVHKEIWAYGFRNPHRFSWDFAYGKRMIAIDIGEANIEEINLIVPGGSYGWGVTGLEGTMHIDPLKGRNLVTPADAEFIAQHVSPHGQYDHLDGKAITGGFVYHGPLKALQDKYIFGDIVTGRLFFMNMGKSLNDKTIYELLVQQNDAITPQAMPPTERAHLRLAYDARTGDLFLLTKTDGRIRRVLTAAINEKNNSNK